MCSCVWMPVDMPRVSSLYHVAPNDQAQVMKLSSQCLLPLNHLTGHQFSIGSVVAVGTMKYL